MIKIVNYFYHKNKIKLKTSETLLIQTRIIHSQSEGGAGEWCLA